MLSVIAFLRKYWPIVAGLVVLGYAVYWHTEQVSAAHDAGYEQALKQIAAERVAEKARTDKHTREVDQRHHARVTELQARVAALQSAPLPPIRVCGPAVEVRVSAPAGEPDGPPDEQRPADGNGPDLRGRLVQYAATCEALRRQVIGLQEHAVGLSNE
jgi:hypothetical protein